ncbi:MAG: hypothetical protein Kow0054_21870 [Deferrisoma sp.]
MGAGAGPGPIAPGPAAAPPPQGPGPISRTDWALLGGAVAFVWAIQFATDGLYGNDGFFHIRFAELMRGRWVVRSLPWLPFSVHAEVYRDHHWLSHLLQVPFTFFPDLLTGAKVSAAFYAGGALAVFFVVVRGLGVRRPGLWVALLAVSSSGFVLRMEMPRVQSQSLALLLAGAYLLCTNRKVPLAAVAAVYVWLYDGFSVLLLLGALWAVAEAVRHGRRVRWGTLAALAGGTAFAVVVNPYFPLNVESYLFNFERVFLQRETVWVGAEWGAPGVMEFGRQMAVPLAALCGAAAMEWRRLGWRGVAGHPAVLWAGATLLFYATARRWVEYAPALCVLAAASLAGRGLRDPRWPVVVLLAAVGINGPQLVRLPSFAKPRTLFAGVSGWLERNTGEGEVVFNVDWDRFPMLFFHNRKNRYVVGLDPNYLYYYEPELYNRWEFIAKGKSAALAEHLGDFGCRYLVASPRFRAVWKSAERSGLERVYEDEDARIYRVPSSGPAR